MTTICSIVSKKSIFVCKNISEYDALNFEIYAQNQVLSSYIYLNFEI